MGVLTAELIGVLARAIFVSIGTVLVQRHVMTGAESDHFATEYSHYLMRATPAIGAVIWGVIVRWRSRRKFLTALDVPAGTTEAQVKSMITRGYGTPIVVLLIALGSAASLPACAPPKTIVTVPGQAAYRADQVVTRLQEVSNVVQDATRAGILPPADAFTVIEWISGDDKAKPVPTIGLVQIIQTTAGEGWKAAALESWKARIKPIFERTPRLAPYVIVIDALLALSGGL